jgi:hypothetical protein
MLFAGSLCYVSRYIVEKPIRSVKILVIMVLLGSSVHLVCSHRSSVCRHAVSNSWAIFLSFTVVEMIGLIIKLTSFYVVRIILGSVEADLQ